MIEVVNNNVSSVVGGSRGFHSLLSAFQRKIHESIFNKSTLPRIFQTKNIKILWMKRVLDIDFFCRGCCRYHIMSVNRQFKFRSSIEECTKIDLLQRNK